MKTVKVILPNREKPADPELEIDVKSPQARLEPGKLLVVHEWLVILCQFEQKFYFIFLKKIHSPSPSNHLFYGKLMKERIRIHGNTHGTSRTIIWVELWRNETEFTAALNARAF